MAATETPRARYAQIADQLRARIESGEYPPGSALPSEPELSAQLDVSRVTINKAVQTLRIAGLVRVRRGLGVYVRKVPPIVRTAQDFFGGRNRGTGAFDVEMRELGFEPLRELTVRTGVTPPPAVAAVLGLAEGETALVRHRRMLASGEPTELATSYIPSRIGEGTQLEQEHTGKGGSYARLADLGYPIARFTEDVSVRSATDSEAQELEIDVGAPVFQILHATWTAEDISPSVTVYVMPGQQWILRYGWIDSAGDGAR